MIVSPKNCDIIHNILSGATLSDHSAVDFVLHFETTNPPPTKVSSRSYKKIDYGQFQLDLDNIRCEYFKETKTIDESVNFYNQEIKKLCDTHAPLKQITIKMHKNQPWFDDELREEIKIRRIKEKNWKKDIKNKISYAEFYEQRRKVTLLAQRKEKSFYDSQFTKCGNDY